MDRLGRSFAPERPYAQRIDYMEIGRTMQVWRQWFADGKIDPVQSLFFALAKHLSLRRPEDAQLWRVARKPMSRRAPVLEG